MNTLRWPVTLSLAFPLAFRIAVGLAFGIVLAGCPDSVSVTDFPPEVAYVALVERQGTAIVDASPLRRVDDPVTFFADLDRDLLIVGYPAEPIDRWLAQWFDGQIPVGAVTPATGCAPRLPAPVWLARNDDGAFVPSTDPPPALSAPWLIDRCPAFDADQLFVNIACDANPCFVSRRKVAPCDFEFDMGRCGQGIVSVVLAPDGAACVEETPDRVCVESPPIPGAAGSFACEVQTDTGEPVEMCATEVLVASRPLLEPVADVVLTDQETNQPGWVQSVFPIMEADDLRRGPLTDLVVLSDQLAVMGLPEERLASASALCVDGAVRPRTLYLLDAIELTEQRQVSLPACAEHLIADPDGPGLLFVYPDPPTDRWLLARTDENGAIVDRQPLVGPTLAMTVFDLTAATDGSGRLFVLTIRGRPNDSESAQIIEVDGASLGTNGQVEVRGRFLSVATFPSGELLLGSGRPTQIEFLRGPWTQPDRMRVRFNFPTPTRRDIRLIDVAPGGDGAAAALAISGNRPTLIAWNGTSVTPAGPLDANFQPGPVIDWPARRGMVLVGGITSDAPIRGVIQAFDTSSGRIVPGPLYTGTTAVTALAAGPRGDIYALFGWSSRVVRFVETE